MKHRVGPESSSERNRLLLEKIGMPSFRGTLHDSAGTEREKARVRYGTWRGMVIPSWPLRSVSHLLRGWSGRLFSFLCIGGFGALINVLCFSIVYYRTMGGINGLLAYMLAFLVATEVSILVNFLLNDRITFRHLRGRSGPWRVRCLRFHMTSMGGTSLTLILSFTLLHMFHVVALLAQALALVVATNFNFVFHHIFTYRQARKATSV